MFVSQYAMSIFILGMVFMNRSASAIWVGVLKGGKGVVTTESGALSQSQYFGTGDREGKGTNPYELIAAAHAACFSLTLGNELVTAGFTPHHIATTAIVAMEQLPEGWTITGIQLDVLADVPRAKQGDFIRAAVRAKMHCTISRLLNTNISMSAKLESSKPHRTGKIRRHINSLKISKTKKQSIGRSVPKA
jgi:osmotically inducible protein OsmC